jgi:hypothetical protein
MSYHPARLRTWRPLRQLLIALASSASVVAGEFLLQEQSVVAPEMGRFSCYVLVCSLGQFKFVPPADWRVSADAERHRILLHPTDRATSICVTIDASGNSSRTQPTAEELRHRAFRQFSTGVISAEFPCYMSSQAGRGCDVQWTNQGARVTSRIACFPVARGTIEFTLNSNSQRFPEEKAALGALLTSFQAVIPERP